MSSTPTTTPAPTPAAAPAASSTASSGAGTTAPKKKTTKKKATAAKASGAGTQAKTKKPAQRKKKAAGSKANTAANQQALLQDARVAASDLAQQRTNAAARKADPLWYRVEDVVPAAFSSHDTMTKKAVAAMTLNPSRTEHTQILERALAIHGVTTADMTPQAMACLLEYQRRFTLELLRDAHDYADMVNRTELTQADLLLAADLRQDNPVAVSTQFPLINQMAQTLNRKPLPPIPAHCYSGILLPPPEHQLTARTFDVVSGAVAKWKASTKYPEAPGAAAPGSASSKTKTGAQSASGSKSQQQPPSYGASRGRQIPVKLNTTASASGGGSTSAVAATGDNKATAAGGAKPMDTSS